MFNQRKLKNFANLFNFSSKVEFNLRYSENLEQNWRGWSEKD